MARSPNTQAPPGSEDKGRGRLAPPPEEAEDEGRYDLGPWTETPASSRVSRYRYDYANRSMQVQWRNNKNHGYVYEDVPYKAYVAFARAVSKGKRINTHLNSFRYGIADADDIQAPSNPRRSGLQSRARG
jgi:KTSC domain